jgi:hypothetical protein
MLPRHNPGRPQDPHRHPEFDICKHMSTVHNSICNHRCRLCGTLGCGAGAGSHHCSARHAPCKVCNKHHGLAAPCTQDAQHAAADFLLLHCHIPKYLSTCTAVPVSQWLRVTLHAASSKPLAADLSSSGTTCRPTAPYASCRPTAPYASFMSPAYPLQRMPQLLCSICQLGGLAAAGPAALAAHGCAAPAGLQLC